MDYIYVHPDITKVLGYSSKDFNLRKQIDIIHEDDVDFAFKSAELALNFYGDFLDVKERFFYKSHYHLKLRNSSGKYKMYLDQQMILSLDKKNKISKAIYNLSDISNSIKSNEHKLSFLDIRGIKSYYNVKSIGDFQNSLSNDPDFSKREIEVIRLISEGMTTKEISNHLFVSPDTIRTHRNNILKKSNEHKLTKVVKMCIKEGLI